MNTPNYPDTMDADTPRFTGLDVLTYLAVAGAMGLFLYLPQRLFGDLVAVCLYFVVMSAILVWQPARSRRRKT